MRQLWILIGVYGLLLMLPQTSVANHMMGIDLTYECLNSCTIRVKVRGYRDCAGAPGIPNALTIIPATAACQQLLPVTHWVVDTTEITPLCPTAETLCSNPNSSYNGVQEFYFYRDYNICFVPNCTFILQWGSCCRSGAITSGSSGQPLYTTQTTLNTAILPCNSSPYFLNPPVPYICAGQTNVFNQGAIDPEGDSLSYAFGPCFQDPTGTWLIYNPGFSPTQPLGPSWNVSLDPVTGDITFVPMPGNIEVGVACILVTEWRNGVAINTIVRDMQITVINCPNVLPTVPALTNAVGGQANGFVVTTCVNNPLCFDIPAVDPDSGQVVSLAWNMGIPGGVFSLVGNPLALDTVFGTMGNPPQAQFCWTPTAVGTYSFLVTVQDDACPYLGRAQFTIQVIVGPFEATSIPSNGGCATVDLCAIPLNGTAPYTFLWAGPGGLSGNPNVTDSCLTHTYPALGTYPYSLQVTDANGCVTRDTTSHTVTVIMQVDAGPDRTICSGGSAQIGTAAVPTYTYSWSPSTGLNNPNLAVPTVTRSNPGSTPLAIPYIVTAMEQSVACTEKDTVLVTVLPQMQPSTTTTPSCLSGFTGTATVNIVAGVAPFVYQWDSAAGYQTTQTATGLSPGSYSVDIVDAAGCTTSATAIVGQPLVVLQVSASMTPVSCLGGSDGTATASAINGFGSYTFAWQPGGQVGPVAAGLSAGTYLVTVSDAGGCSDTATITVTQPSALQLTMSATPNTCALPPPNGTASVLASGATPGYTYLWSTVPAQTSAYAFGLNPGTYTVTVTDAHGCTATASTSVGDIPPPTVSAGSDVSACEGDGGTVLSGAPSGGTPGYWFTWTCGSGNCGLSSIHAASPNANPTTSQYYYVQVTDTNGCLSKLDSLWFEVLPKPVVNAGPDAYICGDSAPCQVLHPVVTAAPGPYTYNWFPSTGLNDATLMNPCARPDTTTPYTLVVTSGNGCTSDFTTTDTLSTAVVHVNPVPVADAGPDREICAGDSVELEGLGLGAGPDYAFEWTPSTGLASSTQPNPQAAPPITTVYTLVVWSNGCPSYGDQVFVDVHTQPTVDAGPTREICLGKDVLLDAQAGGDSTATYAFLWTPAIHIDDPTLEDPTVDPVSTTTYYVQTTTNHGCKSALDSVLVRLKPTPVAYAGENIVLCAGGSVQLQGSYAYTTTDSAPNASQVYFAWTPNAVISDTTLLDPVVQPGQSLWYHLQIRHNTCMTEDSVLITVADSLRLQASADTTTTCAGDSVTLYAVAGLGNASFTWTPTTGLSDPHGATTQAAPDSSIVYSVLAEQGGCIGSMTIAIDVIPTPEATFTHSGTEGCAPFPVSFQQTAEGGVAYIWNFGDGSVIDNLPQASHLYEVPGTYAATLSVVGSGGCMGVSLPVEFTVLAPPVPDFISDPEYPAALSLPASGVAFTNTSVGASSYVWHFDDGLSSGELHTVHSFTTEGQYMVTLTATNPFGCVASVTHGPYIILSPELFIPNVFSPNGDGQNDRFLVEYSGSQPFNLQMMDRWGALLYDGKNKVEGWDGLNLAGEESPDGVYYYRVVIGGKDYLGHVTLVR